MYPCLFWSDQLYFPPYYTSRWWWFAGAQVFQPPCLCPTPIHLPTYPHTHTHTHKRFAISYTHEQSRGKNNQIWIFQLLAIWQLPRPNHSSHSGQGRRGRKWLVFFLVWRLNKTINACLLVRHFNRSSSSRVKPADPKEIALVARNRISQLSDLFDATCQRVRDTAWHGCISVDWTSRGAWNWSVG